MSLNAFNLPAQTSHPCYNLSALIAPSPFYSPASLQAQRNHQSSPVSQSVSTPVGKTSALVRLVFELRPCHAAFAASAASEKCLLPSPLRSFSFPRHYFSTFTRPSIFFFPPKNSNPRSSLVRQRRKRPHFRHLLRKALRSHFFLS